ncbi:hypothetical protein LCI18_010195 [Fusarium solani-melongenae]|uniref:Uncharacterized protein n=1 Tax=Fusarium solani subsp. cucurbitae TaxID=2747967 RepID=A0ACD3ZDH7_FUSSC|nr:hypothetical protein LCI18_010195 [Fusarium solani-melongenae]
MGCGLSKQQRPAEPNYVGTELIRMAPPTRRPGFRPDYSPPRGRVIAIPAGNPPLYEHVNAGLNGMSRPGTSSGIPTIPRIDITYDVIVEQDEALPVLPAGDSGQVGADEAANKATTTTTVKASDKAATGTAKDSS